MTNNSLYPFGYPSSALDACFSWPTRASGVGCGSSTHVFSDTQRQHTSRASDSGPGCSAREGSGDAVCLGRRKTAQCHGPHGHYSREKSPGSECHGQLGKQDREKLLLLNWVPKICSYQLPEAGPR